MSFNGAPVIKYFGTRKDLFIQTAEELKLKLAECKKRGTYLHLAVSGGTSPNPLYEMLAEDYSGIAWESLKLFWADERMVATEHPESNYGTMKKLLLDKISIPSSNIFSINGRNLPEDENFRYSSVIRKEVPLFNGLPFFNLIWLGVGTDGHTASLFPCSELQEFNGITGIAEHPVTHQKRITITVNVINNSAEVIFIITGKEKEGIIKKIIDEGDTSVPAGNVHPARGLVKWYICLK